MKTLKNTKLYAIRGILNLKLHLFEITQLVETVIQSVNFKSVAVDYKRHSSVFVVAIVLQYYYVIIFFLELDGVA